MLLQVEPLGLFGPRAGAVSLEHGVLRSKQLTERPPVQLPLRWGRFCLFVRRADRDPVKTFLRRGSHEAVFVSARKHAETGT